jgi:hypothetical protein
VRAPLSPGTVAPLADLEAQNGTLVTALPARRDAGFFKVRFWLHVQLNIYNFSFIAMRLT